MTDEIPRCQTCDGPVMLGRKVHDRLHSATPEEVEVRICTNPGCRTNGPNRRLSDVV